MSCKIAEYVAEPYVFALKHGARFKWEKDPRKVTAYCPHGVKLIATSEGIDYSCDRKCVLMGIEPCISESLSVDVVGISGRCRYNKKPRRLSRLCPSGFCIQAYNHAYKHALTLLYGGRLEDPVVWCPVKKVKILVYAKNKPTKPFLNIAERLFRSVGHPKDVIDQKIYFRVLSSSGCPKKVEAGQTFEFNLYGRDMMCPTALHSMLGVIGQTSSFICPANAISYAINNGQKDG